MTASSAKSDSIGTFKVPSKPGYRRWALMKGQAADLIEQVVSEMETYSDQRSEHWQDSESGEAFLEAMESIAEIAVALRDLEI